MNQDQILYWNAVALEANRISHTEGGMAHPGVNGPTLSSRALAIVHLAMYDAFVGTSTTTLVPYILAPTPASLGASTDAAIAAAAHRALSSLYPNMRPFFDSRLTASSVIDITPQSIAGRIFGIDAANRVLADRSSDPTDSSVGYNPPITRGSHREDPDNSPQGYNAPFYGASSKCFSVSRRWGLKPYPAIGTPEYTRALRQVKAKGIAPELMGTLPTALYGNRRTNDETLIGIYWGYDGAYELGTPPRLYNQIVRKIAMERGNSLEQNAQLFALVNVAMGDAGILAWDQKYLHNLWRPVLGVRENDESMGIDGVISTNNIDNLCDPNWLPLGAPKTNGNRNTEKNFTPPFPAYPSGHATFGAAALHITKRFYGGDNFDGFEFISDECDGVNKDLNGSIRPRHLRKFDRGIDQMIFENGVSRVYLGVHWHFDAFALKSNAFSTSSPDGRNVTMGETDIVVNTSDPNFEVGIGGVPLGIAIANDIFSSAITKSLVGPRS